MAAQKLCPAQILLAERASHILALTNQTPDWWICFFSAIKGALEQKGILIMMYACTWTAVGGQVAVAGSIATITAVDAAVFVVGTGVGP